MLKSPVDCSATSTSSTTRSDAEPGLRRDLDGLEIVQVLQPPLGAVDQRLVVGIAFGDVEFAPDHVVARAGIAVDVDALDIGARPLIDREGDVDAPRRRHRAWCGAWPAQRESRAWPVRWRALRWSCRARCRRTVAPGLTSSRRRSFSRIQPRHVADDVDVAEMIERAFVDREGQRKSLCRRIVFGVARRHAGVGIALAAVIQPQRSRSPRRGRDRRRRRRSGSSACWWRRS